MSDQAMSPRERLSAVSATGMPSTSRWSSVLRYLIGAGIAWLVLGLVVMPAGVSFNPSRSYEASLIPLLYLPALWAACLRRGLLWRELFPLPLFRMFLLLLAWALVSLTWAHLRSSGDEVGRLVTVVAFALAWQVWDASDERHIKWLLYVLGLIIAACAAIYCGLFLFHPEQGDRIAGIGTIATTNYAAALMGAVCVLLVQLPLRGLQSLLRWLAAAVLLVFVVMTQTRNIWLALCVCLILAPLWRPERAARWVALLVLLLVMIAFAWPLPALTARGASLRPELFMQSLHLIAARPLLGLGLGTPFTLLVYGQPYTHSHNVLTQMTIELGLPGLLLLLVLWIMVGWQGWRHRRSMRGQLILAMWVYASVALQFDMPQVLDSPRPGWLLIWLPFALALNLGLRERFAARAAIMPR